MKEGGSTALSECRKGVPGWSRPLERRKPYRMKVAGSGLSQIGMLAESMNPPGNAGPGVPANTEPGRNRRSAGQPRASCMGATFGSGMKSDEDARPRSGHMTGARAVRDPGARAWGTWAADGGTGAVPGLQAYAQDGFGAVRAATADRSEGERGRPRGRQTEAPKPPEA